MSPLADHLLADNATTDADGRLLIGGVETLALAEEYGTPLFVYDEAELRARCREAVTAFPGGAAYATKAFVCGAMVRLAHEEGMELDVASGGEMAVALAAGVPADRLVFHGNNKSTAELREAIEASTGRIVVDSFDELARIEALAPAVPPRVLLRVTPGVEAHTHEYVSTGQADSKFGFGIPSGAAREAVERVGASAAVELVGIHMHIGSQVFVAESFAKAFDVLAPFFVPLDLPELSVGGGLGVAYVAEESSETITDWGARIREACLAAGITARVTAEPGRSIVAKAGLTLYTVGTIKTIPQVRTYIAVDGGMIDNPRPALYGSGYEAFLPRDVGAARTKRVRVVGKHCESGDVLIRDAVVPEDIAVGDVLAVPVTGAYGHSMGSNYNKLARPAVVFVRDGEHRLVIRRETYADLLACDLDVSPVP